MASMKVISETIEFVRGSWWFCQRGVYTRESVLAGQDFRQLVQPYDTPEAAKAEHPRAKVYQDGEGPILNQWELSHNPPAWFHEEDAGERWDDDY